MASSPGSHNASPESRDEHAVSRIEYEITQFRDAGRCLHEMHDRLECGWTISDVRLPGHGQYQVIFRKDGPR